MPTAGDRVSFGSFSLRFKENEPGCRAGTRRSRMFFKGYKAKSKPNSGGRGPRRRLTFLPRSKKASKETRPSAWPCGFPALRQLPSRSQNSAAPQTFLAYSAGNLLRSGCGAMGMLFNPNRFSIGFPGRGSLQKKPGSPLAPSPLFASGTHEDESRYLSEGSRQSTERPRQKCPPQVTEFLLVRFLCAQRK